MPRAKFPKRNKNGRRLKAICICGVLDFSLIGILSEIAAVLADNAISIFCRIHLQYGLYF